MEILLDIGVEILRLVPLILAFYIPALLGMVVWRERGQGYRAKTALVFALGFGTIIAVQLLFGSASALQAATTVGLSLFQAAVALALASITVYKLAD